MSLLTKPVIRMPDFAPGEWLNSDPLTQTQLRGRVVLVDIWDYSCLYCLQTLPYVMAWHERYAALGLQIIGIHTPEFRFGAQPGQVATAVAELGLRYPILLDNQQENWDRFANKAWPSKYLIDHKGYIRYMKRGTGGYRDTELAIQQLLLALNPALDLPAPMPPRRDEDKPGAVCYPATPELHAGYNGGLFGGALGNPDGYYPQQPTVYDLPEDAEREHGRFYLRGIWQSHPEAVSFAGQEEGQVVVPYEATAVNAVLSPTADDVALRLDLWRQTSTNPPLVEVKIDGRYLSSSELGEDVVLDEHGRSVVQITRPRLYKLTQHLLFGSHELTLIFRTRGVALYTFTFETCTVNLA